MINKMYVDDYLGKKKIPLHRNNVYDFFLLKDDEINHLEFCSGYTGVLRYNHLQNCFDLLNFTTDIHKISRVNGEHLNYTTLEKEGLGSRLKIHTINLNEIVLLSREVHSFVINDHLPYVLNESQLSKVELLNWSERYIGMVIPNISTSARSDLPAFYQKYGWVLFEIFLIDIEEKKIYKVPESIGSNDFTFRYDMDFSFKHNAKYYVALSTGRIGANEKERVWNGGHYPTNRIEDIQSLVVIPLDEFVELVKSDLPIASSYIIDQCSHEAAFSNIFFANGSVYSLKYNFPDFSSELLVYDLNDHQSVCHKLNDRYQFLIPVEGKLYGTKNVQLIDVVQNNILHEFEAGSFIIYFDKNMAIFSKVITERLILVELFQLGGRHEKFEFNVENAHEAHILFNTKLNALVCLK
ncbi:hypothetical protein ACFCP7_27675 [Paenibacillus elgii]